MDQEDESSVLIEELKQITERAEYWESKYRHLAKEYNKLESKIKEINLQWVPTKKSSGN